MNRLNGPTAASSARISNPQPRLQLALCCADTMRFKVWQLARRLQNLGFQVRVSADIRAEQALLRSAPNSGAEDLLYVVCVPTVRDKRRLMRRRQIDPTAGWQERHVMYVVVDRGELVADPVTQICDLADPLARLYGQA